MFTRFSRWTLAVVGLLIGASAAVGEIPAEPPLTIIVMDPLAAPLSCPCVEGYAQRDYEQLAAHLTTILGRPVAVYFDESLPRALKELTDGRADLVVGKESIVLRDLQATGRDFSRIAQLTDKEGAVTQTGLVVVRTADPALTVADLAGYRVIFGPAESDEKHAAALALLAEHGVEAPAELETRQGCDEGATLILELPADEHGAAVISSYARPLLEGCGTVPKGALRVVGRTEEVPFISVFLAADLDEVTAAALTDALFSIADYPALLKALESRDGFVDPEPAGDATDDTAADGTTWPGWRGPRRDGHVPRLPETLPVSEAVAWRLPLARPGLGGLAATADIVIVSGRDVADAFDEFRCLDSATGEELWIVRQHAAGRLDYGNSPRATPLIAGDLVYLLGAFGHLHCVDLDDGTVLWRRDLRRDFAAEDELVWGVTSSPLSIDGLLIVNPGGSRASLVALDADTGDLVWQSPGEPAAFASFVEAHLGGVRQLVGYDRDSLGGWNPASGERLWRLAPRVDGDFNVPTPLVDGDSLIVCSENNGTRRYRFDASGPLAARTAAETFDLAPDMHTPVMVGRRLFGVGGRLMCFDVDNGFRMVWEGADAAFAGYASLIADDRRLLVLSQDGTLLLVDALADEYRPLGRLELFPGDSGVYSHPAIAGGRLFARGSGEIVCLNLPPVADVE